MERFVKPHKALTHKPFFLWLNFSRAIIPIWKEVYKPWRAKAQKRDVQHKMNQQHGCFLVP